MADSERDNHKVSARIAFAAIAVFVIGIVVGSLFSSFVTFGVFTAVAVLILASILLLINEDNWY